MKEQACAPNAARAAGRTGLGATNATRATYWAVAAGVAVVVFVLVLHLVLALILVLVHVQAITTIVSIILSTFCFEKQYEQLWRRLAINREHVWITQSCIVSKSTRIAQELLERPMPECT